MSDKKKAGSVRIVQTAEALCGQPSFLIEYFEVKENEYVVLYEHEMTWCDLQYSVEYLKLGLTYDVLRSSVKLQSLEFISWCRLMKRLIGARRESFFIQEKHFKEFSKKLSEKTDKSQIGVIITRKLIFHIAIVRQICS